VQSQSGFNEAIPIKQLQDSWRNVYDAEAASSRGLNQDLFVYVYRHPAGKSLGEESESTNWELSKQLGHYNRVVTSEFDASFDRSICRATHSMTSTTL